MRRQARTLIVPPKPISKKEELLAALRQRDALWALLDNIDTLDDACRGDTGRFRELVRAQLSRRFHIHKPES